MWIAQLFGILFLSSALSVQKGIAAVPYTTSTGMNEALLKGFVQCLEVGDFRRPQPFVVEALLIYAQCML